MSKSNVCIVGLSKQFTDNVCQQLAIKLEMFYANIDLLFEYELSDMDKIEKVCGIEYLVKEQVSIVKRTSGYDNTLINIDYPLLNNDEILDIIKQNCLLIYIRISKDKFEKELNSNIDSDSLKIIEIDAFDDRDCLCQNMVDLVVDCVDDQIDNIVECIVKKIIEYYS